MSQKKTARKGGKKRKKKKTGKEEASGGRKRLSTAVRTDEESYASSCFLFTWKEKLRMKSAREDDRPFWLS